METENIIFGVIVALALAMTCVMGWLIYGEPARDPARTLRVLTGAGSEYMRVQNRLSEEYAKIRPDVDIEIVAFPGQNIWRKLEFLIVAGIPPDVTGIEQPYLQRFVYLDAVEPLDDWMANDPEFDPAALFPSCMDEGNWDNIQYAMPNIASPVCLWYNKTLFDAEGLAYPNRDWDLQDLVAAARKLTKDLDGDGILDQYGFHTNNNHWNRYPCWVWMMGAEFMTPDQRRATFDAPETVSAIRWLADLALKEKVMPGWTFLAGVSAPNLFISGRLAMTAETRYFLATFASERNRDKVRDFQWDVCELPHDKTRATTFVVGLHMIPRTLPPEKKSMAWDYIKFLSSPTGQRVYAELNTALPARMDVARAMVTHPATPPANDIAFINAMDYARYFYWPFPSDQAFTAARSEFMGVWTGNLDVEDVCRKVSYNITRSVDDFMRANPNARLPVKTKWVPLDQRPPRPSPAPPTKQRVAP